MTLPVEQRRILIEEYLRLEGQSDEKHELWDGWVVPLGRALAMAGGSYEHSLITANTARACGNRIEGGPCRVLSSDLRIRLGASVRYVYPDVSVICGPPQFDPQDVDRGTVLNPRLVVEVLSPSTESIDRREKLQGYLQIETVEEYVLISQTQPRVESFFRQASGSWLFTPAEGPEAQLQVLSLKIVIPLSEIYAGVEFPPETHPGGVVH